MEKGYITTVIIILVLAVSLSLFGKGMTGQQVLSTQSARFSDSINFFPYQVIEVGEQFRIPNPPGYANAKFVSVDENVNQLTFNINGIKQFVYDPSRTDHFGAEADLIQAGIVNKLRYDETSNKLFLSFNANRNKMVQAFDTIIFPTVNICIQFGCTGQMSPDIWRVDYIDNLNRQVTFTRLYSGGSVQVPFDVSGNINIINAGQAYNAKVLNQTILLLDSKFDII